MNFNAYCCLVIFILCLTCGSGTSECNDSSDCQNYAICFLGKCICQYGNATASSSKNGTVCNECRLSIHCPQYARCSLFHKCKCKYGGAVYDSKGKLVSCNECSSDGNCPGYAMCNSNKCNCKFGGASYSTGQLVYCLNECNVNDDCPPYSSCNRKKRCECDYGVSFYSDGTTGTCATSLATVVCSIVGTGFFLTVIIVVICRRRWSIAREAQEAAFLNSPTSQGLSAASQTKTLTLPVHQSDSEEAESSDDGYPKKGYTRL